MWYLRILWYQGDQMAETLIVLTFAMDAVLQKLTGFSPYHRVLLDPIVHLVFYVSNVWAEEYIYISAWYTWYTIPILHVSISCGPGLVPGMGCYILIYTQLIGTVECCICRPTGEIPRGTNSIHIAHQWKPKLYPARGHSVQFYRILRVFV